MNEADQLRHVAEACRRHGVLMHHCNDSRRCSGNRGLPDLILVGPAGILFRELKTGLWTTSYQNDWRLTLIAAGIDAAIWLPSHFRNGTIDTQIANLAHITTTPTRA